ncbi:uncharacterized protein LOC131853403 [Achroia grisella]|uniref:uncharacterized protein LOC131853400 n=1 Tax=Achroia grisella TaxID=688607 RepID=UPI0027D2108B|nr:uncharacterized protein LOC131853400 [Achroia grisella]XP_059060263.1 uncharacterized protein LOC131853401 [Achroia grisella]XP_059060266.1 uncharacterized protein LOC131853403 [Achroia grisella]
MAYSIKYLSLQKSELVYEVELRGGTGESVQELRKQIIKLSQLLPSEDILESHLDPTDDLKEVKESLIKSQSNLTSLKNKLDKNLFNRTETLLHHIYHRLNRIVPSTELTDIHKTCISSFNSQFKELSNIKSHTTPTNSSASAPDNTTDTPTISVTCERNLSTDLNKLKYSGKTCVHSFIQRVEEYVQSRGITFDKILTLAYEIFVDDALHWYRYNKDRVNSWNDLCALLREDFSSSDYDYRLAAEIRSRTQGEHENITIYLSIMHGMFSRLSKPMNNEDKLDILMHNIRPCYANTLAASPNIKSMDELKSVCRNYETVNSRFLQFHEPPRVTSSTLAPEFAYKYKSEQTKYNYNKQFNQNATYNYQNKTNLTNANFNQSNSYKNQNFNVSAIYTNDQSRQVFCPRCRSNSHSLSSCSEERFPICFKCGKKDVRYPECPDCNTTHKQEPAKN